MSEGMRRRNVASKPVQESSSMDGAFEALKSFDVYAKVQDDYLQKSQAGGIVTVITSFIIAILFWSEIREFCTIEIVDTISVDTRINQKLPIGLNITFPHLRCDEVSVDTVDSAGDNQVNVHGGLGKEPLDAAGNIVIDEPKPKEGECLPCLEGADDQHKCCNTCQELKEAYIAKDLPYYHILDTAVQCKGSIGCRVHGKVTVNKVSGNVHVALGRSTVREGKHVHEFNMHDVSDGFNTSHEIRAITFGDQVPGMLSPLDGTTKIVRHGAFMFHYYIKLVPTVFIDRWGTETYTNQYSATDSARNVQVRSGELSGLPGVFIVYDFSPFLMRKTEKVKPWSYIFTSICAIIGGVFSIASLVEMVVHSFVCRMFGCNPGIAF
mmetsp:Transcript_128988/g.223834  ORF Transcript_128988/g.223834 Transcript_128988/m.223834 type:complete len:380 (-) Transcript_128988:66-1205(-)